MKSLLLPILLLSRAAIADGPPSADAIACFDTLQSADAVVAAEEVDDSQLPHLHSLVAADLVRAQRDGKFPLVGPLVYESPHAYLSRVLARLKLAAPRIVRQITKANHDLKGRVAFEKASIGPVAELDAPEWDGANVDRNHCVLVPVIAAVANESSVQSESDPIVRMDRRFYRTSALGAQSRAILLLRAILNRTAPSLKSQQASALVGLFLALNPDETYDSYLKEIGEQGLLSDLPQDGKVWAAPGYELFHATIDTLIGKAYPYLQDDFVSGGKSLRIKAEATGRSLDPGFECPRSELPQAVAGDNDDDPNAPEEEEDLDFTRFRACSDMLAALFSSSKANAQKSEEDVTSEISGYLTEKSAVAEGRTIQNFENPDSAKPSLQQKLEGFDEFTAEDRAAINASIGLLTRQIGVSIANDGSMDASGKIELADPFAILRETPLHYLEAKVPQIDGNPMNDSQINEIWADQVPVNN